MFNKKTVAKAISVLTVAVNDLKKVVEEQQNEISVAQLKLSVATKEKAQAERILDKLEDLLR